MDQNQRTVKSYHDECIEIDTTQKYQLTEIAANRRTLLKKAKSTQEYRCLTSLRSGYCLRMTSQSVTSFVQLPFIRPEGFFVNDQFVHTLGLLKTDVYSFINSIYSNFTEMPKAFAKIETESLIEKVPFLPSSMKPRDFLACSTLPALFCHCWSIELRHSYIDFLMEISKELPQNIFPKFREHWLFECFKNYIHGSNIHHFLALSIGEMIFRLVRQDSTRGSPQIAVYAMEMIKRMRDNMSTFPKDVRLLLKKFSDLAPNKEQRLYRIEILFIDCILVPAISLPKAYCVLPPSYQLDMSPTGPMKTLNSLAQLLRMILHIDTLSSQAQIPQSEIDLVKSIPLADFLNEIVNIDEEKIDNDGPRITRLMSLLQTESMNLMFTMSDICLLAKFLIHEKLPSSRSRILQSNFFTSDTSANLDFFKFEFQKCEVFEFKRPEIVPNVVEKPSSSSEFTDASYSLFKFLTVAKEHDENEEKTVERDLSNVNKRRKKANPNRASNTNNPDNRIDNFTSSKFNSSVDVIKNLSMDITPKKDETSSDLFSSYSNLGNQAESPQYNGLSSSLISNMQIVSGFSSEENLNKEIINEANNENNANETKKEAINEVNNELTSEIQIEAANEINNETSNDATENQDETNNQTNAEINNETSNDANNNQDETNNQTNTEVNNETSNDTNNNQDETNNETSNDTIENQNEINNKTNNEVNNEIINDATENQDETNNQPNPEINKETSNDAIANSNEINNQENPEINKEASNDAIANSNDTNNQENTEIINETQPQDTNNEISNITINDNSNIESKSPNDTTTSNSNPLTNPNPDSPPNSSTTNIDITDISSSKNIHYIDYYKRTTKLHKDYTTDLYLSNLVKKLDSVGTSNFNRILNCLEDDIRRNREYLDRNDEILANIARMVEQLDAEIVLYQEKADQSYPIIYSSLLQLFLESDKTIETVAEEKKLEMLIRKNSFHEFYSASISKLKSFITPIAEYALQGVASHFHTWLMQKMTLDEFIEANGLNDYLNEKIDKQLIEKVCVEPAPPKLNKIFSSNQLFDFVMMELREAEVVEIPLEAVNYISSAINLIQRMFDLAIGGAPQADEMTPLFNYSLMSSGMNRMVSFEKYLEHFLYELPQNDIKLLNDSTSIALTHFINHVSSLTEIVDKCT